MVNSGPVMVFNSCVVTKLTSVVERSKWMDRALISLNYLYIALYNMSVRIVRIEYLIILPRSRQISIRTIMLFSPSTTSLRNTCFPKPSRTRPATTTTPPPLLHYHQTPPPPPPPSVVPSTASLHPFIPSSPPPSPSPVEPSPLSPSPPIPPPAAS